MNKVITVPLDEPFEAQIFDMVENKSKTVKVENISIRIKDTPFPEGMPGPVKIEMNAGSKEYWLLAMIA